MSFAAVLDASVLAASATRDILVRLAQTGIFSGRWTERALDEMEQAIVDRRPPVADTLGTTRELMCEVVRDCMITDYEDLVCAVDLPDPDRCLVVAAAIKCGAQVIVTGDSAQYPDSIIGKYGIEAQSADQFLMHLMHLDSPRVVAAVQRSAAVFNDPPLTIEQISEMLESEGLTETVEELQQHLGT